MPGNGQEFGPCVHCGELHAEEILLCPRTEKLLPLEGRLLDGKFRFTRKLGEGGMGAVWRCENTLVRKSVAIKLMHIEYSRDEGVLARFRNEATAAGRIGSHYICDILDLGRSSLGPYIVMEMLNGKDFAAYVQAHHPISIGLAAQVIRQALLGLQAAHDAGIVHRDLKPENIFLHEPQPGQMIVKLMDFGISKFTEGSEAGKTGMGVLMGTPEFMSPEQSEGAAKVDQRTDIWAIGVILYWALSGKNPFLGHTMAQTLMRVAMQEAPELSSVAPHVPSGLSAVIHRCLAKDPNERWSSARELYGALEVYERPQPGGTVLAPVGTVLAPVAPSVPRVDPRASRPTPSGIPTFSNEISAHPASAPTLEGGDWSGVSSPIEEQPHSNIRGGGMGWMIGLGAAALLLVGGGGVYALTRPSGGAVDEAEDPVGVAGDAGGATTPASATTGALGTTSSATPAAGTTTGGDTKVEADTTSTGAAAAPEAGDTGPQPAEGTTSGASQDDAAKDDAGKGTSSKGSSTKGSSSKGKGTSKGGSKGTPTKDPGKTPGDTKSTEGKGGTRKPVRTLTPSRPPRDNNNGSKLPGSG